MNKDVQCPYCDEWQEINHDDGYGVSESELHQQECGDCEKTFTFQTCISFDYSAFQADCLNGGEHKFKLIHHPTFPEAKYCTECWKLEMGKHTPFKEEPK